MQAEETGQGGTPKKGPAKHASFDFGGFHHHRKPPPFYKRINFFFLGVRHKQGEISEWLSIIELSNITKDDGLLFGYWKCTDLFCFLEAHVGFVVYCLTIFIWCSLIRLIRLASETQDPKAGDIVHYRLSWPGFVPPYVGDISPRAPPPHLWSLLQGWVDWLLAAAAIAPLCSSSVTHYIVLFQLNSS